MQTKQRTKLFKVFFFIQLFWVRVTFTDPNMFFY